MLVIPIRQVAGFGPWASGPAILTAYEQGRLTQVRVLEVPPLTPMLGRIGAIIVLVATGLHPWTLRPPGPGARSDYLRVSIMPARVAAAPFPSPVAQAHDRALLIVSEVTGL